MASRATTGGGASALPLNLIAQAIPKLTRFELTHLCERLVDALDDCDGDPDTELNGDELDGSLGEDDFCPRNVPLSLQGPGCPIGDPDVGQDEIGCASDDVDREDDLIVPIEGSSDLAARAHHRQRIRHKSCGPDYGWEWSGTRPQRVVIGHRFVVEPHTPSKRQLLARKRGAPKHPRA